MKKYTLLKKLQCLKAKPHSNSDKNLNCNHLEMDVSMTVSRHVSPLGVSPL